MFPVIIICLSLLYIAITFIRSREKRARISFYINTEMEKYYDRKAENMLPVVLQKALFLAATSLEKNSNLYSEERKIMLPLHNDRIISAETWKGLMNVEEDIEIERKEIMAEAEELRPGWEDKIFDEAVDAARNKGKDGKCVVKMNDDPLFLRKRDVLTKDLLRKFEKGSSVGL